MQEEAFECAQLISRYLQNQLTPEEESQLMTAFQNDARKRQLLEYYKHTQDFQERLNYINSLDVDAAWQKVKQRHPDTPKAKYRFGYLKYVAVFALIISSVSLWLLVPKKDAKIIPDIAHHYKNDVLPGGNIAELLLSDGKKVSLDSAKIILREKDGTNLSVNQGKLIYANIGATETTETLYNTLLVPRAGTYALELPDGTRVWLNAMSELKFPLKFNKRERKVELKGEAYFEVKKDASHPFKISLNGSEIEVLGTSFNVSSYDRVALTTLVEGSVRVRNANQTVVLKPGEQSQARHSALRISKGDIEKATAWKHGYFHFSNDSIATVLAQMAKWYDLKIIYKTKVPQVHIGGIIDRKVKLSEALQMLKDVSNLSFEIEGRNLIVN